MPLNDLKNELYNSGTKNSSKKEGDDFIGQENNGNISEQKPINYDISWGYKEGELAEKSNKRFKTGIIILVAVVVFVGVVAVALNIRKNAFREERVIVEINGLTEVKGEENAQYIIKIRNNNRTELKNAELSLNYSDYFKPGQGDDAVLEILNGSNSKMRVGEIPPQQEKKFLLSGKFYAPRDSVIFIEAKLTYSPGNYSNRYERKNQIGVKTISSSLQLDISAPPLATDGDQVTYVFNYQNSGSEPFADAQMSALYPSGFEFVSADPQPTQDNNIWKLGDIPIGGNGKITIQGNLKGFRNENKTIQAIIGKYGSDGKIVMYNKTEKMTSLAALPLLLTQKIKDKGSDNTVNPGDGIAYIINIKNNGEFSMKDLVVKMQFNSKVLDFSKMSSLGGYYDSGTNTITWKYSEVPGLSNLEAGAEENITLAVPVFQNIPVDDQDDKNFVINSIVRVDTPSLLDTKGKIRTVSSEWNDLKLNTAVTLDAGVYRKDENIENYGPYPLKQGEETSFVLKWGISNVSNNISGTKVSATIPTGVKWTGRIYPSGEKISYDERTNEIIWEPGAVSAGRGVLGPKKSVSFQLSVTPQPNQALNNIVLINPFKLVAKDDFTGKDIHLSGASLDTDFLIQ